MNILSFCANLDPGVISQYSVIQASAHDIQRLVISPGMFDAILIEDIKILKLLKKSSAIENIIMIPVIILLKKSATSTKIRDCLDSGASDFCIEPYKDLKEIIYRNEMKLTELKQISEKKFNRLRNTLSYAIPHEFHTPLTTIIGLSSMMAKEGIIDMKSVKQFSMNILNATNRLRKLIDNYVYYSHLQIKLSSESELNYARSFYISNPEQIIKQVVLELKYIYKRKVEYKLINKPVQCNETNFYKLIYSLVENALKFSDPGSVVSVDSAVKGNDYIIIAYNEGQGFDKDELNLIGPYTQFDRHIYEQQGIGLGLAIVQSIVRVYNGHINIISEKNKYVKIEIYLKTREL